MSRDQMYPAKRVKMLDEPVNAEDVRSNIFRSMAIMEETVTVANTVLEALKPWNKKRVNKRIGANVQAALGSKYAVHYAKDKVFNRTELNIWARNEQISYLGYNNQMTFSLTRGSDHYPPIFDLDWFATNEAARYITRNVEEIAALTEQLEKIDEMIAAYNEALPDIRDAISKVSPIYPFAFENGRF